LKEAQKSFVAVAREANLAKRWMAAAEHWPQLWPLSHRQLRLHEQYLSSWMRCGHCWGEWWGGMRQQMKGAHEMQGG